MSNAKHIGRVEALAVALGVGFAVAATPVVGYAEPTDSGTCKSADSAEPQTTKPQTTALILGGTTVPTPDDAYIDTVRNHFIGPTHPGQINYCAVTAPMEFWPITGAGRLVWLVLGPRSVWGLDGPGWPDEPLWKLSGFFDVTFDQSVAGGVADLEDAITEHPGESLVIFGYSQGAMVANIEKQKLADQYPNGDGPDIEFVLIGDPNLPNGGLAARFPGLYIPIANFTFNGPAPTDTQFHTVEDINQYDGAADFPLYPLNLISTGNALLGAVYRHPRDLETSVNDPGTIHTTTGDTDYYFHPTDDLPLFDPLRTLGVPEPVIDVVEPFFKVIVELGYDRSIKPGEPTPARLLPSLDPGKVPADLVDAVGEGITNAQALIGAPPLLRLPAAPVTVDRNAAVQQEFSEPTSTVEGIGRDVTDGVEQVLNRVGSLLPTHPALTQEGLGASQGKVGRVLAGTRDQIQQSIVGSAGPARKNTVRDAVSDLKKVVNTASHNLKKTLSGGRVDNNHTVDRSPGGAQ